MHATDRGKKQQKCCYEKFGHKGAPSTLAEFLACIDNISNSKIPLYINSAFRTDCYSDFKTIYLQLSELKIVTEILCKCLASFLCSSLPDM